RDWSSDVCSSDLPGWQRKAPHGCPGWAGGDGPGRGSLRAVRSDGGARKRLLRDNVRARGMEGSATSRQETARSFAQQAAALPAGDPQPRGSLEIRLEEKTAPAEHLQAVAPAAGRAGRPADQPSGAWNSLQARAAGGGWSSCLLGFAAASALLAAFGRRRSIRDAARPPPAPGTRREHSRPDRG